MWAARQRKNSGFTIVEVMIVLAVTGLMFAAVAVIINGKQQTAEFESGIHDVQAQIQQAVNEVASGYYPNNQNFSCSASGAGALSFSDVGKDLGTNSGCVFLGKILHFYDGTGGTDNSKFDEFVVAGWQGGTDSLAAANPQLIPLTVGSTTINSTITNNLEYGLNVIAMCYQTTGPCSSMNNPTGSVGFMQTVGTSAGSGLVSGAQQLDVLVPTSGQEGADPLAASQSAEDGATDSGYLNDVLKSGKYLINPTQVDICFQSATTDQSGLITIGGGGSDLTVGLQVYSDNNCGGIG